MLSLQIDDLIIRFVEKERKKAVNKKVWILDDKKLTHDKEFDIYKKHGIEWRWTTTSDYHHDLQEFGKDADVVGTQVGYPMDDPFLKQLEARKDIGMY